MKYQKFRKRILPFLPLDEAPSILEEMSNTLSLLQKEINLLKAQSKEEYHRNLSERKNLQEENVNLIQKVKESEDKLEELQNQNVLLRKEHDDIRQENSFLHQSKAILQKKIDNYQLKISVPTTKISIPQSMENEIGTRGEGNASFFSDNESVLSPTFVHPSSEPLAPYLSKNQEKSMESRNLVMMEAYKTLIQEEYQKKEKLLQERYHIMLENNTNRLRMEQEEHVLRLRHDIESDILGLQKISSSSLSTSLGTEKGDYFDRLQLQQTNVRNDMKEEIVNRELFGNKTVEQRRNRYKEGQESIGEESEHDKKLSSFNDHMGNIIYKRKERTEMNTRRIHEEEDQQEIQDANLDKGGEIVGEEEETEEQQEREEEDENRIKKKKRNHGSRKDNVSSLNEKITNNTTASISSATSRRQSNEVKTISTVHNRRRSSLNELLESLDLGG